MKSTQRITIGTLAVAAATVAAWTFAGPPSSKPAQKTHVFPVVKTDAQWKKILPPASYDVLRHEGTEPPFTGQYAHPGTAKGIFVCAACDNPLFDSKTQFDSGTGWPSYYQPLTPKSVVEQKDTLLGYTRTEVECSRCGGHLGHVFDDGPKPTGLRYCMNSVALKFVKKP